MDCSNARLLLGPDPQPASTSPELVEAHRHYGQCEACRAFFAAQRKVAERLRRLAQGPPAPAALRARVLATIDQERRERERLVHHRRWAFLGGGALVAAAAVAVLMLASPADPMDIATPFVRQVTQRAAVSSAMTTGEVQLAEWLASQMGSAVHIPVIPDAELLGGRVTQLGDVRTAVVDYRIHGMSLTYFHIPAVRILGRPIAEGDELLSLSSGGYEVVMWRENDSARAVVSPMSRRELQAIAEHCRRKSMT